MIRLFANNDLYFSFNVTEHDSLSYGDRYVVTSLTREREVNTLSNITFTTMMDHPRFYVLTPKRTLIVLADDDRCLFIGKVASIKKNIFQGTAEVECEEILGCLRDEYVIDTIENEYDHNQFEYTYRKLLQIGMSGITNEEFLYENTKIGYNCDVNLPYATATIETDTMLNGYTVEAISGNDYLSLIYSTVLPWTGANLILNVTGSYNGNLKTYSVNALNLLYSVYFRELNSRRTNSGELPNDLKHGRHDFVYGENILNIDNEPSQKYPISGVLPYGVFTDNGPLDNGEVRIWLGKDSSRSTAYVWGPNILIGKIGYVAKTIDFGNIGKYNDANQSASNHPAEDKLYNMTNDWVSKHVFISQDKLIINAIDKYFIDPSASTIGRAFDIYDCIRVEAPEYNLDYYDYCLSLKIDYFNHENDQYVIGPYIPDNELEYKVSNFVSKAEQYKKSVKNKKNKIRG